MRLLCVGPFAAWRGVEGYGWAGLERITPVRQVRCWLDPPWFWPGSRALLDEECSLGNWGMGPEAFTPAGLADRAPAPCLPPLVPPQGKMSNYATDLFMPIFAEIQRLTGARSYTDKVGWGGVGGPLGFAHDPMCMPLPLPLR